MAFWYSTINRATLEILLGFLISAGGGYILMARVATSASQTPVHTGLKR